MCWSCIKFYLRLYIFYMKKILSILLLTGIAYASFGQGTIIRTNPVSPTVGAANYNKQVVQDANLKIALTLNIPTGTAFTHNNSTPAVGNIFYNTNTQQFAVWNGTTWQVIGGSSSAATWGSILGTLSDQTDLINALNAKQATLVSGTNIKTVNGNSLLGSGDLTIAGGVTSVFGRTGVVTAQSTDYSSFYPLLSGSYANPSWITSLAYSKITGVPAFITTETDPLFDTKFSGKSTTNLTEGSNLYFTQARVSANTDVTANTAARHNAVTLGTPNGLSLSGQQLSLGLASSGVTGALSGSDWNTFNAKQNQLILTTSGTSGAASLIGNTLNIPNYATGGAGSSALRVPVTLASNATVIPITWSTYSAAFGSTPTDLSLIELSPTGDRQVFTNWYSDDNGVTYKFDVAPETGSRNFVVVISGGSTVTSGNVTSVTSANSDIGVINSTTTPVLTLNSGTGANQIVKRNGSGAIADLAPYLLSSTATSTYYPLVSNPAGYLTASYVPPSQVQNSLTPNSTTLAPSVTVVNNALNKYNSYRGIIDSIDASNLRNDQSAVIELSNNRILVAYSHFKSNPDDSGEASIWAAISSDGGVTHGTPYQLIPKISEGSYIPSFYRKSNGNIVCLFYVLTKNTIPYTSSIYRAEYDSDMNVVSAPTSILSGGYTAPASDRIFKDEINNRLIYPYAKLVSGTASSTTSVYEGRILVSSNDGSTWTDNGLSFGSGVVTGGGFGGALEPGIYYDKSKGLVAYFRTLVGSVYASNLTYSGGNYTASTPYSMGIASSNAQVTIKYLLKKDIYLAANMDVLNNDPLDYTLRKRLTLLSSYDGLNWSQTNQIDRVYGASALNEPTLYFDDSNNRVNIYYSSSPDGNNFDLRNLILPYGDIYQQYDNPILNQNFLYQKANSKIDGSIEILNNTNDNSLVLKRGGNTGKYALLGFNDASGVNQAYVGLASDGSNEFTTFSKSQIRNQSATNSAIIFGNTQPSTPDYVMGVLGKKVLITNDFQDPSYFDNTANYKEALTVEGKATVAVAPTNPTDVVRKTELDTKQATLVSGTNIATINGNNLLLGGNILISGGSGISGLTTNYITKATSSTTIGNSLIFDNGTNVGIGTSSPSEKLQVSGNILLTSAANYLYASNIGSVSGDIKIDLGGSGNRLKVNGGIADFAGKITIGSAPTSSTDGVRLQDISSGQTIGANTTGNSATSSSVPWTGVSGRPTALSQFTNDLTPYTLPTASASVLGGVKVGSGLSINGSGVLSSTTPVLPVYPTSASTYSMTDGGIYRFTGSASTFTLPPVAGNEGKFLFIANRGSGTITLNTNTGANELYNAGTLSNTASILSGATSKIINDGVNWSFY